MTTLPPMWPHQARAVQLARDRYREGSRAICITAPTGAGKLRLGVEISIGAARKIPTMWLVHRREIRAQAMAKLPPGIRVETIQGLLASGERPPAGVIVADECHHLPSGGPWHELARHYSDSLIIGLTATPERADGRPLGDIFTSLVVAAHYSELLAGGYLVDCDAFAPDARGGLAMTASEAVRIYGRNRQAIAFCDSVKAATRGASEAGGQVVLGTTPTDERDSTIKRFLSGEVRSLFNVYCLTEGFDAPAASLCVLARSASHPSTYLQMVGRVLRAHPGKSDAVLVDLCGSYQEHRHPTQDRIYSLEGKAISRAKDDPIWQCKSCGWCTVYPPADRICPSCGEPLPEPKQLRLQRRRIERQKRNAAAKPATREKEYAKLKKRGEQMGYKPGWAKFIYKFRYGDWPPG